MSTLAKYEPQMEVTTFSKKKYYFPKKKLDYFLISLNESKFLIIQWSIVNTSSIDTIDPAGRSDSFVEDRIKILEPDHKRRVKTCISSRKAKVLTPLTPWTLENIITETKDE